MFCPKCGNPDQSPETYCRKCGIYLPDLSKPIKKGQTPEDHVRANIVLNSMTIVTCLTLAVLLYSILGFKPGTHPLIYVTGGVLLAITCWHVQTLWRTILLRQHFKKNRPRDADADEKVSETGRLLTHARFEDIVPPSVTDRTTQHLEKTRVRSS